MAENRRMEKHQSLLAESTRLCKTKAEAATAEHQKLHAVNTKALDMERTLRESIAGMERKITEISAQLESVSRSRW